MALFNGYSPDEIKEQFTHKALFCGIVPVYIGPYDENGLSAFGARNGVPEFVLDVAISLYKAVVTLGMILGANVDPTSLPMFITGELE